MVKFDTMREDTNGGSLRGFSGFGAKHDMR